MKIYTNYGKTHITFSKEEQDSLLPKVKHLIEGKWFKEKCEEELETILFDLFPQLKEMGIYLAKAFSLNTHFDFHPVQPKVLKTKTLYHLTAGPLEEILRDGLVGQRYSNDGIRYLQNRIYFSLSPFVQVNLHDSYLNDRIELKIEFDEEVEIFIDPEFDENSGMVFMTVDSIPASCIEVTGYKN